MTPRYLSQADRNLLQDYQDQMSDGGDLPCAEAGYRWANLSRERAESRYYGDTEGDL